MQPHSERLPRCADPEQDLTGSVTHDPEDLHYDTEAALLEDLETLALWDDYAELEAELYGDDHRDDSYGPYSTVSEADGRSVR